MNTETRVLFQASPPTAAAATAVPYTASITCTLTGHMGLRKIGSVRIDNVVRFRVTNEDQEAAAIVAVDAKGKTHDIHFDQSGDGEPELSTERLNRTLVARRYPAEVILSPHEPEFLGLGLAIALVVMLLVFHATSRSHTLIIDRAERRIQLLTKGLLRTSRKNQTLSNLTDAQFNRLHRTKSGRYATLVFVLKGGDCWSMPIALHTSDECEHLLQTLRSESGLR